MTKGRVLATLKYTILIAFLGAVVLFGSRFFANDESPYPYPYTVNKIKRSETLKASKADILIIGGSQGKNLNPFLKRFITEASKSLKNPLKLYNWARENEPMGVTLQKVKTLEKFPMITLYIGGSDELHTTRFKISEFPKIIKNLKRSENESLMTAMLTTPALSRLVYTPVDKAILGQTRIGNVSQIPDKAIKHLIKLHYTLYKNEVEEIFDIFKLKDATVWVAPAALNINSEPLKVCDYTESQESFDQRKKIKQYLNEKRLKEAKSMAIDLVGTRTPNPMNYYILGQTLLGTGDYQKARSAFYQARMYDCGLSYSTPIHLKILMEQAEKRGFKVVDFNRIVLNQLGRNQLFFDEQKPQNIYYNQFIDQLLQEFKTYLER